MKSKWNALPIIYKLFSALVGAITLIIIALILYLGGYESALMLEKEKESLHIRSEAATNELNMHLMRLQKEINFIARLEVMDDIVVRDMDRRITGILEQKADDLGESIELFMIDPRGMVQAASKPAKINTVFKEYHSLLHTEKNAKSYFYQDKNLYLFTPVYGTFYTHDIVGYLIMVYPLENFGLKLKNETNYHQWLSPEDSLGITYDQNSPIFDEDEYLYDSIVLDQMLSGWTLHYTMPKNEALALIYHFQKVILIVFAIGLILIAFLVWIILIRIIKPLRELSDTAMEIAVTGDYSRTLPERGSDEIGTMAYSFNALMYSTLVSMKRLEIEREIHNEKLVNLIVFFNAITRSETIEETIEIAIQEIKRLSGSNDVFFDLDGMNADVNIALNAVGNETEGFICIKEPKLVKEANERFYEALERMLALQMERIELLGKAQAAVEAKSAFLSSMSHELRTPLGSVLSLTQYLMTLDDTPEATGEMLGKIENSAHHLLGVINNILDLAKAESGKIQPHLKYFNPIELIEEAIDLLSPLAEDKGLEITTAFDPKEVQILSDMNLMGQVIMNLLSNAIKYTQQGSIHISMICQKDNCTLQIQDTGMGIAHDAIEHLFDEFYQVHTADTNGLKGSGLGLAISKKIALLLHGDLWISSEGEGKGTTATFVFHSFHD